MTRRARELAANDLAMRSSIPALTVLGWVQWRDRTFRLCLLFIVVEGAEMKRDEFDRDERGLGGAEMAGSSSLNFATARFSSLG